MSSLRGDTMGTTPKQWSGQRCILRKTFDSDRLARRDGYTVNEEYYVMGRERIPRKKDFFVANATGRILGGEWVRIEIKVPVIYGTPWRMELQREIERELKTNYDLIGVFLREIDPQWCRTLQISWEGKR